MSTDHRILKLWTRPEKSGAMVEQQALELVEGQGIVGDHTYGGKRHVTIVFAEDWAEAEQALGHSVDPAGRRANVLVSGGGGGRCIGSVVRLGEARVEIVERVAPCPIMEQAAKGLQDALEPGERAGVWGRVIEGAAVEVGELLTRDLT